MNLIVYWLIVYILVVLFMFVHNYTDNDFAIKDQYSGEITGKDYKKIGIWSFVSGTVLFCLAVALKQFP